MSENVTILFEGAKNYAGPRQFGSDLLPFEGPAEFTIQSVVYDVASRSKDRKAVITAECDTAGGQGMRVIAHVAVSGRDKNGKPKVEKFYDWLWCALTNSMEAKAARDQINSQDGKENDGDKIRALLEGKKVYGQVKARDFARDDGTTGVASEIDRLISKQEFAKVNKDGNRRPVAPYLLAKANTSGTNEAPQTSELAPSPTAGAGTPSGAANGATAQAQAAPPSNDPLSVFG